MSNFCLFFTGGYKENEKKVLLLAGVHGASRNKGGMEVPGCNHLSRFHLQSLRKLSHPNIVKLREVIRENDELFFIFEYCDGTVYQMTKDLSTAGKQMPEDKVRSIIYQV